jgi:hypothetical protein
MLNVILTIMKKLVWIFALFLIALVACEMNQEDQFRDLDPGILYLQMEMQYIPLEVSSMSGILSRDGFETVEFALEISNQSAFAVVHGIEGGAWLLQVYAYNAMDEIIYSGSTDVEVIPNEITPVHLDLTNTGSLEISVSWGGEAPTGDDRFENDDTMEEATHLYEGEYYQNLYIESGDDDWFEVSLSAPHIGVVINYRDHHGDIRMELYGPDGTLLASSKHLHDYSIIDYYSDNLGTLYVRVYSASGQSRSYMIWWQDWYDF